MINNGGWRDLAPVQEWFSCVSFGFIKESVHDFIFHIVGCKFESMVIVACMVGNIKQAFDAFTPTRAWGHRRRSGCWQNGLVCICRGVIVEALSGCRGN